MIKNLAVPLAYLSSLSLAVAIVDTQPFDEPGFEKVQRTIKCPAGQEYNQATRTCHPKR